MNALRIMGQGETVARKLFDDLRAGRLPRIGRDEIEHACDEHLPGLNPHDRELLVTTVVRRVVEMA